MQPYVNPNYFMQNQPQMNPYLDRMNFLQGYQQSLQQAMPPTQMSGTSQMSLVGKIVDSVDVVKATDIPMDGNMYYFPKADGTEIFGKQWQSNGTTRILTFKPCLELEPTNLPQKDEKLKIDLSEGATEVIMKRFDELEKRIDEFISKKPVQKTKKESEVE